VRGGLWVVGRLWVSCGPVLLDHTGRNQSADSLAVEQFIAHGGRWVFVTWYGCSVRKRRWLLRAKPTRKW